MVKNVCLMLVVLLMVHLNCDAATAGDCESCMSGAAADLGMFDLADVLLKFEEVASK